MTTYFSPLTCGFKMPGKKCVEDLNNDYFLFLSYSPFSLCTICYGTLCINLVRGFEIKVNSVELQLNLKKIKLTYK